MSWGEFVLEVIGCVILAITAGVVTWYTIETSKMRKAVSEQGKQQHAANVMASFARTHAILNGERAVRLRFFMHEGLEKTLLHFLGNDYSLAHPEGEKVDVGKVLNQHGEDKKKAKSLVTYLRQKKIGDFYGKRTLSKAEENNPPVPFYLDAAEETLTNFELLAIPVHRELVASWDVASMYRTVLEDSAPALLIYIALQWRLLGEQSRHYRGEYIALLRRLNIEVPNGLVPDAACDRENCAFCEYERKRKDVEEQGSM